MAQRSPKAMIRDASRSADIALAALGTMSAPPIGVVPMDYLAQFSICFSSRLYVALLEWRSRVEKPTTSIKAGLEVARQCSVYLASLPLKEKPYSSYNLHSSLDFSTAIWMELLINKKFTFDNPFFAHIPSPTALLERNEGFLFEVPDTALFHLMHTESLPSDWDDYVRLKARHISDHFTESVQAYADLIQALITHSATEIEPLILLVDKLYHKRGRMNYLFFEGGGGCNQNLVDYRLGAILWHYRRVLPKNVKSLELPHFWIWK